MTLKRSENGIPGHRVRNMKERGIRKVSCFNGEMEMRQAYQANCATRSPDQ